ncbi:MAG: ferredoxin family protein [Hyphomicrobiales bacterium]|nr:MAG: ferredoxin family protein [Hyphomicrobiales bacterium]
MPFVVNENCIRCKFMDCVEVCPAECFYEGESMLVIHPDECIDCGLCEPHCPVEAIIPDSYPQANYWGEINHRYALLWPRIRKAKSPPPDADEFRSCPNKYRDHFSPNPGSET